MIFIYFIIQRTASLPKLLNFMCQIIDQDIFSSEENQTDSNAQQKNNQTLLFKTIFSDHFSNLTFATNTSNRPLIFTAFGICNLFYSHLQLLIEIQYSSDSYYITGRIIEDGKEISIKQHQIRKSLSKQLRKKSLESLFSNFILLFSIDNGQLLIKSPIIYSDQKNIKQFKKGFQKIVMKLMNLSKVCFINISKLLNERFDNIGEQKKFKISQILKYYYRCTTQPSISVKSDCAEHQSAMIRYAASRIGLQDLLIQNTKASQFGSSTFGSVFIYGEQFKSCAKSQYLDEITLKEKQRIQQQIIIPSYFNAKNNKQNKFIYNHCYFFRNKYDETLISQGGNSDIYVIKPEIFQYASANAVDQKDFVKNEILNKYIFKHLVFKKYYVENIQVNQKNKNYLPHQNQIIPLLRGGSCVFLPKYYLNVEKQSSYENYLFMDYLPGQTLDEYISLHSTTVSTLTKFYILLQILQTLRFLNQYGVVHLDIKQKNIIIMKNVVSKTFDFSQSYHYKVCGQNHKPKYTTLYGCPQAVTCTEGRIFTQKSDVFSFGIMAHRILFNRYPYQFGQNSTFQRLNFQGKLRQKTFYCPQMLREFSYSNIIEIINQLILKCIDMEEYKRPYLDWMSIILKCSLNYITNQ